MRTLAVTGDDFGFSRGANQGICDAHDRGILTHASLMVAGDAASEAVALARSRPALRVGLHLVIVDGRPSLPAARIPRLVDSRGRFRDDPLRAGLLYQFSRGARVELEQEIRAQLTKFRETGLPLSHVDGHHHLHLHPVALEILIRLSAEFAIARVRLPSEEIGLALELDRRNPPGKILWSAIFSRLRRHAAPRLRQAGIAFSERVYGLLSTGRITEEYLLGLIPRIRANTAEIYCHPALELPGETRNGPPGAGPAELQALLSRRVADALAAAGLSAGVDRVSSREASG